MSSESDGEILHIQENAALIVIDVQEGFDDPSLSGTRNNNNADRNIESIIKSWESANRPVVVVQHNSIADGSVLNPSKPGNSLKPYVKRVIPELHISKTVNSAFYGTPDLDKWLKSSDIHQIVIIGIQTNMCCETTARMAGNLGYDVIFVPDAMHTFDATGPDGIVVSADEITRATVASLFDGEFAKIASTEMILNSGGHGV
jgi:nicotinamidase-related amidase